MAISHSLSRISSSRFFAEYSQDQVLRYADCLQLVREDARSLLKNPCHKMKRFDLLVTEFLSKFLCELEYRK